MSIDAAIIKHVDRFAPITHAVADQPLTAISPSLVVNVSLSVSETAGASESPSVESGASLSAVEAGRASESPSVDAEATPSVEETGAATEAPSVITSASLSVLETVTEQPLLDQYPGAAAAYILRKLRDAYSGNAIRVRRSLDNSEQNFTPTEVTDGTLESFCGSGDGFIVTKNDQTTGSNEENQSTETNQPKIVSSGTLISDGIEYDGSDDFLISNQRISLTDFSLSFWTKTTETDDFAGFLSIPSAKPRFQVFQDTGSYVVSIRDANGNGTNRSSDKTINDDVLHHVVVTYDASADSLITYFDGSKDLDTVALASNFSIDEKLQIGTERTRSVFLAGHIRQVLIYDRILSETEAQGIFNNFAPPQL